MRNIEVLGIGAPYITDLTVSYSARPSVGILPHAKWDMEHVINTFRPRQNGRRFADDIFKCIFLNENIWITIGISLKFFPRGPINNIPALVQIMAWHRLGDKPLSEPIMSILLMHICVTLPQWVKIDKEIEAIKGLIDMTPAKHNH